MGGGGGGGGCLMMWGWVDVSRHCTSVFEPLKLENKLCCPVAIQHTITSIYLCVHMGLLCGVCWRFFVYIRTFRKTFIS